MTELTLQIPDDLAERIRPLHLWMPAIIELSLVGFTTPATWIASEITQFLATDPSPQTVLNYFMPEKGQKRLQRLLALNEADLLDSDEERELDELEKIEHIMILLKTGILDQQSK